MLYTATHDKKDVYLYISAIVLIIGLVSVFAYKTYDSQVDLSENFTPDYSSLERNIFYGAEEGKYENLPEAGKALLREALMLPECVDESSSVLCMEHEYTITHSSILAFANNFLLMDVPSQKAGASYEIYNVTRKQISGQHRGYFGSQIRNESIIIYVNNPNSVTDPDGSQTLSYYRPGMKEFSLIPHSNIPSTELYWYFGGMGSENSKASFDGDIVYITIFNEWTGEVDEMEVPIQQELREIPIDLSTIV